MSKIALRKHIGPPEGEEMTLEAFVHPLATFSPPQEGPVFGPFFDLFSRLGAFLWDFSTLRRDSGCGTETDSQNASFYDPFSEGEIMRKCSK